MLDSGSICRIFCWTVLSYVVRKRSVLNVLSVWIHSFVWVKPVAAGSVEGRRNRRRRSSLGVWTRWYTVVIHQQSLYMYVSFATLYGLCVWIFYFLFFVVGRIDWRNGFTLWEEFVLFLFCLILCYFNVCLLMAEFERAEGTIDDYVRWSAGRWSQS